MRCIDKQYANTSHTCELLDSVTGVSMELLFPEAELRP
eukprot:COSAG06_NODE_1296_length_9960_cov_2.570009_1_plen_38_part_00